MGKAKVININLAEGLRRSAAYQYLTGWCSPMLHPAKSPEKNIRNFFSKNHILLEEVWFDGVDWWVRCEATPLVKRMFRMPTQRKVRAI